jgi:hypothetical protein
MTFRTFLLYRFKNHGVGNVVQFGENPPHYLLPNPVSEKRQFIINSSPAEFINGEEFVFYEKFPEDITNPFLSIDYFQKKLDFEICVELKKYHNGKSVENIF